jgi:integrase
MRKRYQQGSVTKSTDGRYWVGKYRVDGKHKTKLLGKCRGHGKISKTEAQERLVEILRPLSDATAQSDITLKNFVEDVFLPFCRKRWKPITDQARTDSITRHICGTFGDRALASLKRDELQAFLDDRKHLAITMVDHLRWDIKQILDLAVAEGVIPRNPVYSGKMLLFVPKECKRPERPVMTLDQARLALSVLDLRERLVLKFAVLAGMRVSEIYGLRRGRIGDGSAEIVERVCRGDIDTPKTWKAVRTAALPKGVQKDLQEWLKLTPDTGPDGWLFPSENLKTPMNALNMMARYIRPRLKRVGLGWVDYRVMRRTHSSLAKEKGIDPKLVADQQGHGVDVNQNVYTQTSVANRLQAVQIIESALEAAEPLQAAFVN